jgi:hypothetical protein
MSSRIKILERVEKIAERFLEDSKNFPPSYIFEWLDRDSPDEPVIADCTLSPYEYWINFTIRNDIAEHRTDISKELWARGNDQREWNSEKDMEFLPGWSPREWANQELNLIENLLEEAQCLRRGTIPDEAWIEINFPPFVAVKLWERQNYVIGCFIDADGNWVAFKLNMIGDLNVEIKTPLNINNYFKICNDQFNYSLYVGEATYQNQAAHIAISLASIAIAIVRDFVVVEDRLSVLGPPKLKRITGLKSDKTKRVIYLPRIRYQRNIANDNKPPITSLERQKRRSHFVRDHIRKLPETHSPSKSQIVFAKLKGIELGTNETFVGAHMREGEDEFNNLTTYRSRSATRTYFDILKDRRLNNIAETWMQFEDHCIEFLKKQHFTIIDRSKFRQANIGDEGCDILASKILNKQDSLFVVQVKFWQKSVGPAVIREIEGTKKLWGATDSCVISWSGFTDIAIETANELGVLLFDGGHIGVSS